MKDKKRRLLGIILTLALVVGMIPMTGEKAYAASGFDITISSSNVTTNLSGTGSVGGSWSYNGATKTLTLTGYQGKAVALSGAAKFNIVLVGENKITNVAQANGGNTYGIHVSTDLNLSGDGSLKIDLGTEASSDGISLRGIEAYNLTVSAKGKVKINLPEEDTADYSGISGGTGTGTGNGIITLEKADVEINGGNHAILNRCSVGTGVQNIQVKESNLKINGADKGITSEKNGILINNSAVDINTTGDCIQAEFKSLDTDDFSVIAVETDRPVKLYSDGKRAVTIGSGNTAVNNPGSVLIVKTSIGGSLRAKAGSWDNPQTVINTYISLEPFVDCVVGEAQPGLSNPDFPTACLYNADKGVLRFTPIISISAENFPDPKFRAYIKSTEVDKNGDGFISGDELDIELMDLKDKNISSLKGIEYFAELGHLYCRKNKLTSLDVSKNTKLKELDCHTNQLTALDVSKNPELLLLRCYDNPIESLDLSGNPKLITLEASYCNFSEIDLSPCSELQECYVGGNKLTTLNLIRNPELHWLGCNDNPITTLDLSHNPKLIFLDAGKCNLSEIDLSPCSELRSCLVNGNQLTTLDVSKNTKLTKLYCYKNQLTALDLSANTDLEKLDCSENKLTELNIKHLTKLYSLRVNYNQLVMLDLEGMEKITGFYGLSQKREVTLTGNSLKFSQLNPSFNKNKVSNIAGGYINDAGDGFIFTKGELTYKYDTGAQSSGNTINLWVTLTADTSVINVSAEANGIAYADAVSGFKGQEVHLASSPYEGYVFDKWVVTSPSTLSVSGDKFIMPGEEVSIQAQFKPIAVAPGEYSVTVQKVGFGTAKASLQSAAPNAQVTLTASAIEGYKFKEWQVISPSVLEITDNKFTMPGENVVVKAIFEVDTGGGGGSSGGGGGAIIIPIIGGIAPPAEKEYHVTADTPKTWQKGSDKPLSIMTDGNKNDFKVVKVDGKDIPAADYTATDKGVEIKATYLETLTEGNHKFTLEYADGKAEVTVEILKASEEPNNEPAFEKIVLKSTKVTLKNGKRGIKLTWKTESGKKPEFDGFEIFRSTKRNSGYGKKPIFTTKKTTYNNSTVKKGVTYYYKVRGFIMKDGQKVYTEWSTKAKRKA